MKARKLNDLDVVELGQLARIMKMAVEIETIMITIDYYGIIVTEIGDNSWWLSEETDYDGILRKISLNDLEIMVATKFNAKSYVERIERCKAGCMV
jgi:hypothetical protein